MHGCGARSERLQLKQILEQSKTECTEVAASQAKAKVKKQRTQKKVQVKPQPKKSKSGKVEKTDNKNNETSGPCDGSPSPEVASREKPPHKSNLRPGRQLQDTTSLIAEEQHKAESIRTKKRPLAAITMCTGAALPPTGNNSVRECGAPIVQSHGAPPSAETLTSGRGNSPRTPFPSPALSAGSYRCSAAGSVFGGNSGDNVLRNRLRATHSGSGGVEEDCWISALRGRMRTNEVLQQACRVAVAVPLPHAMPVTPRDMASAPFTLSAPNTPTLPSASCLTGTPSSIPSPRVHRDQYALWGEDGEEQTDPPPSIYLPPPPQCVEGGVESLAERRGEVRSAGWWGLRDDPFLTAHLAMRKHVMHLTPPSPRPHSPTTRLTESNRRDDYRSAGHRGGGDRLCSGDYRSAGRHGGGDYRPAERRGSGEYRTAEGHDRGDYRSTGRYGGGEHMPARRHGSGEYRTGGRQGSGDYKSTDRHDCGEYRPADRRHSGERRSSGRHGRDDYRPPGRHNSGDYRYGGRNGSCDYRSGARRGSDDYRAADHCDSGDYRSADRHESGDYCSGGGRNSGDYMSAERHDNGDHRSADRLDSGSYRSAERHGSAAFRSSDRHRGGGNRPAERQDASYMYRR